MKLYMFRTFPLFIIRSFSLYTQQWYMSYRFVDSFRAGAYAIQYIIYKPTQPKYTIDLCLLSNNSKLIFF